MAAPDHPRRLTQRDLEILRDVIHTYILTGEAVSSRSVAKLERHNLSSASIRNIMADLEEWGYLVQPHTSAGRVPTREGYHLYIESLMKARVLPARERRYILENIDGAPSDSERLIEVASHLLSELSQQIGIVVAPGAGETVLKALDLVPLNEHRVLCVIVSASGFVESQVVEIADIFKREDLVRMSNFLNASFAGKTLREIRDLLLRSMAEEKAMVDRWLNAALRLAQQAIDHSGKPDLVFDGTAVVLGHPELANLDRVRRLLDTFADRARLVQLLSRMIEGKGVRVVIGEDSDLTSELDFSLVATSYGIGQRPLGRLGIFGPSRMEYQRVIPLVNFLGEALSRALESRFGAEHQGLKN